MDIISKLPDSLLSHILSFLPTKLASSTCVLSKRWQFLWTTVHNLDLALALYTSREDHPSLEDRRSCAVTSFVNFVDKIFLKRDKDLRIKRFCLKTDTSCSPTHVDSWVLSAMLCGLEELELQLYLYKSFRFRCSIFTCKTLVVLRLNSCIVIDAPPSSIHFPSLKVLHLLHVCYENHHSFTNLFSGCPILEDLAMVEDCEHEELRCYMISSPTLRKLAVTLECGDTNTGLWVDAPSLEYLYVELFRSRGFYLNNVGNLVEGIVNLEIENVDGVHISEMIEDFLSALYNVQVLKLQQPSVKDIEYGVYFERLPIFHNVTQLKLGGYSCCCFWMKVVSLLHKAPNLQRLAIDMDDSSCGGDCEPIGLEVWSNLNIPNCFSNLRTFCFTGPLYFLEDDTSCDNMEGNVSCDDTKVEPSCNDTEVELLCFENMEFVKFVLKDSTSVENMTLTHWGHLSSVKRQELATIGRGSKKCLLTFDGEVL